MSVSEPETLARAENPGLPPQARFQAARKLIDRRFSAEAFAALNDIATAPEHASEFRKLELYAQYVQQMVQWLDFAGAKHHGGRWETPDGRVPGTGSERTGMLLWLHPGATRVVLVFSNAIGGFGTQTGWHSIGVVHRVLKPLETNIVYLYDDTGLLHFSGVAGLGRDYAGCIGGMRALLEERGWTGPCAFGTSSGGYSALRYGLDLELKAVLSMSGLTMLDPADPGNQDPRLLRFLRKRGEFAVDLLPLYLASARRPRMLLCYGELNSHDARHAQRMAELPEAELIPFHGYAEHSTFIASLRDRRLGPLMQRLLACA